MPRSSQSDRRTGRAEQSHPRPQERADHSPLWEKALHQSWEQTHPTESLSLPTRPQHPAGPAGCHLHVPTQHPPWLPGHPPAPQRLSLPDPQGRKDGRCHRARCPCCGEVQEKQPPALSHTASLHPHTMPSQRDGPPRDCHVLSCLVMSCLLRSILHPHQHKHF